MSKIFEPGDHVLCTMPFSADEGCVVEIVRPTGPGVMDIYGMRIAFQQSYQVRIPNIGDVDPYSKRPIIYPAEFLEYAEPPLKLYTNQPVITNEGLNDNLEKLGYKEFFENIWKKRETK